MFSKNPLFPHCSAFLSAPFLSRGTSAGGAPAGYRDQAAWKKIQTFLPKRLHFSDHYHPKEEWWDWQGNQIHLDVFRKPAARHRIILLHGVGTNGRQMSLLVGSPLAKRGYETIALDLPGYGVTKVNPNHTVTYDDWVQLVSDFIDAERKRDPRPIILYGLSAGGMLAYHVAARNPDIAGIVGMTFLDQRQQNVRDETASNKFMSRVGGFFAHVVARSVLGRMKLPMSLTSKMRTLVNDPHALKAFLDDRSSAGNWVSLRFLDSYLNYVPAMEPEQFRACPVLLTQPANDAWTPLALSEPFLKRLQHVFVKTVMLKNAGHYPLEEPGITQMHKAMVKFIEGTNH
ncbi:MAG: alpha/beta hydrolase [Burkholderiaceae bacterium]|jgi:alpha-beta hydrolase superfamily lysophospholipase|nr:alpha/beta hydrolase [Burkholderiaceae bacterium]